MGAQISEAIRPDNITGSVRFDALLIAENRGLKRGNVPSLNHASEIVSQTDRALQG
jgi:hypothetical protein